MLLATLGMMLMVSANDLIALYVGLELQRLALYVVAAFHRDSVRSTEAGAEVLRPRRARLGHAALRRLAGLRLLRRHGLRRRSRSALLDGRGGRRSAPSIGLVFVIAGLAFKVSAVPFHMWTPDVYEGAPTPVTAFFAVAPKIAAIVAAGLGPDRAVRPLFAQWQQIVVVVSVAVDGARRLRRHRPARTSSG